MNQCQSEKKTGRFTHRYKDPYYLVNLLETPVYAQPDDKSTRVYEKLEKYRIVRMKESVSLANNQPIWYKIEETNIKGYAVKGNFRIFKTLKEAESFKLDKYPAKKMPASLSIYQNAEKDYKENRHKDSVIKLFRFLELEKDLQRQHPIIYYSTNILIGQLFLRQGETNKAIGHFELLLAASKTDKPIDLFGNALFPNEIRFYVNDVNNYRTQGHYRRRATVLKWETALYIGLAYEMEEKTHKAATYFQSLLDQDKNQTLPVHSKTPYINQALDHLLKLSKKADQLTVLEAVKKKVDWRGSGRYLLFKMAELLAQQESDDLFKSKRLAMTYYQDFIRLFNEKYKQNPYPGEISHFLKAQKSITLLQKEIQKEIDRKPAPVKKEVPNTKQPLPEDKKELPKNDEKDKANKDEVPGNKSLDKDQAQPDDQEISQDKKPENAKAGSKKQKKRGKRGKRRKRKRRKR